MNASFSERVISPERRALSALRTPLTQGESEAIAFFDRTLPSGWEIYVQPHLNGLRPDIVLLHPERGLAVYEIKDWDFRKLHYQYRATRDKGSQLWCRDHSGMWFRQRDEPFAKVIRYRDEIRALYCPRLGAQLETNPGAASAITAGVILTKATTAEAHELFQPVIKANGLSGRKAFYNTINGCDALQENRLANVFPWAAEGRASRWMNENTASDLRSWLIEPDHSQSQRNPLPMNSKQREIATTRTTTGYRRIRGPAGSGKSLAIAARAAQMSAEGKAVLVISFNITLLHYLRDLAVRYPDPNRSVTDRITWLHFHGWCKRTCEEAGYEEEYKALWSTYFAAQSGREYEESDLKLMLAVGLPSVVANAIRDGGHNVTKYDAILCDEGQDLNLDWWNLLRSVLRTGGEMLLAADRTQDLYSQAATWTETSLENAGFRGGRWYELDGSYRFPAEFVTHLQRFVEMFLTDEGSVSPVAVQGDLLEPLRLEWVQVPQGTLVDNTVDIIRSLPVRLKPQLLKWSDLAIIAQTHEIGSEVVERLDALGIRACHVFGNEQSSSRWRKSAFWMGDSRVKAATFHSFKGWESPHVVVVINSARHATEFRGIYVALSRLCRSVGGSALLVVCDSPELAVYGETWATSSNVLPPSA